MNRLQKDLNESGLLAQSSMSAELKLAISEGNEIIIFPSIKNTSTLFDIIQ